MSDDHTETDLGTVSNLPVKVEIPGYRLRAQVGEDAIGLWFDAEQRGLGRNVTVKILRPRYDQVEAARKQFLAEMDRLAPLDHALHGEQRVEENVSANFKFHDLDLFKSVDIRPAPSCGYV